MPRKARKKGYEVKQWHHITYDPPRRVLVTRTEHYMLGNLGRYKKAHGFTHGFKQAMTEMMK